MGGFWSTQYPSLRESLGAGLLGEGRLVVQISSGKGHGGFYAEVAGLSIVEETMQDHENILKLCKDKN